jgi:hypothetical protein
MGPNDIHKWLKKQPFQPFQLPVSNGRTFEVQHPELVLVARNYVTIGTPAPDFTDPVADRVVDVALVHIDAIEPLSTTSPPISN